MVGFKIGGLIKVGSRKRKVEGERYFASGGLSNVLLLSLLLLLGTTPALLE